MVAMLIQNAVRLTYRGIIVHNFHKDRSKIVIR